MQQEQLNYWLRSFSNNAEDFMIQRMADNDKIVTRYMDDKDFQDSAFPILAKEIFHTIRKGDPMRKTGPEEP